MTQYSISSGVTSGSNISIKAGATFDVRLIRVDLYLYNFGAISASVGKTIAPSGYSGGTVLTPYPTREGPGAPTAGATCRNGATITGGTGGATFYYVSDVGVDQAGANVQTQLNTSFSPPTDIILQAGSSSVLSVAPFANSASITLFFEELRLFWSL